MSQDHGAVRLDGEAAHSPGDGLVEKVAARCIRDLARDVEDLNRRIAALDAEIEQLLAEYGNPVEDVHGAGRRSQRP